MKLFATAAAVALLFAAPAIAQTQTSPQVDANGVGANDQARPVTTMTKDINSPYNTARSMPRDKNKVKGAPGGGGQPANGLAAGGGGPASKPPTPVQHN
jgi:opacity protein-like surface antigen